MTYQPAQTRRAPLYWIDPRYEVSDLGSVYSRANSHGGWSKNGPRLLKTQANSSGYAQVRLPINGKYKWVLVSRLVLQAFTGTTGEQANHKNGLRLDNRLENLEWTTVSENMRHSYRVLGRKHPRPHKGKFGALNKLSKRVSQYDLDGNYVKTWEAVKETARAGFSAGNVSAVCRGERRSHKGFIWKFVSTGESK
jgi:hypothetical protein